MPLSDYIKGLRSRLGNEMLLLPAVSAIIINDAGEVLLQRRSDTGMWALIGGMVEPGEQPAAALVREVLEETGLRIAPERVTGVYLTRVITYSNGDVAQYIITAFRCRPVSGHPHVADDESLDVGYFPLDALPELNADYRGRIEHAVTAGEPYFTPPDMETLS